MASQLFATKSVDLLMKEAADTEHGLKRALRAVDLVMLGVGAIIGAGIFVMTGVVAAQNAGPAIILSFVAAGIACAFAGLCYSEMASMIPIAGSAYTYSYATMREFLAWISRRAFPDQYPGPACQYWDAVHLHPGLWRACGSCAIRGRSYTGLSVRQPSDLSNRQG